MSQTITLETPPEVMAPVLVKRIKRDGTDDHTAAVLDVEKTNRFVDAKSQKEGSE
jgi:hypothetical protein